MRTHSRLSRIAQAIGAGLLITFVAAACGGSAGSGSTSGPVAGAGDAAGLALASNRVEAYYRGTSTHPPVTAPTPDPGKNIWVVDYGLSTPAGVGWANSTKQAGAAVGWKVNVFNANFTPSQYTAGIRSAIAAGAQGIVTTSINCEDAKAALQQAKAARIPVVNIEGIDCPSPLFSASIIYNVDGKPATTEAFFREMGAAQADWVTVKTKGQGKVIDYEDTDLEFGLLQHQGFMTELKRVCPGCQVLSTVPFTLADLSGTTLQQKVSQSLLQNPTADALVFPYDDAMTAGGAAAVMKSGRNSALNVIAGTGEAASMNLIRSHQGLDASYAEGIEWEGYAAIDTLNRLFHHQAPQPSGLGLAIVDATHNLPPEGQNFNPDVPFVSLYEKAWGVH